MIYLILKLRVKKRIIMKIKGEKVVFFFSKINFPRTCRSTGHSAHAPTIFHPAGSVRAMGRNTTQPT